MEFQTKKHIVLLFRTYLTALEKNLRYLKRENVLNNEELFAKRLALMLKDINDLKNVAQKSYNNL